MIISGSDFVFWEYIDQYGVFDERGDLVGVKRDAPEEIKASWEEYQKVEAEARAKGLK